jgi:hypothetical protein
MVHIDVHYMFSWIQSIVQLHMSLHHTPKCVKSLLSSNELSTQENILFWISKWKWHQKPQTPKWNKKKLGGTCDCIYVQKEHDKGRWRELKEDEKKYVDAFICLHPLLLMIRSRCWCVICLRLMTSSRPWWNLAMMTWPIVRPFGCALVLCLSVLSIRTNVIFEIFEIKIWRMY